MKFDSHLNKNILRPAQKMKFFIKHFFIKCDHNRSFLRRSDKENWILTEPENDSKWERYPFIEIKDIYLNKGKLR